MATLAEVRSFFGQARGAAVEAAERRAGRARRAAAPRLQAMGRLGSPIQEFTFAEIERATQEALAPQLAQLGVQEAGLLTQVSEREAARKEREEARRAARRGGLLRAGLELGGLALPFLLPGGGGAAAGLGATAASRFFGGRGQRPITATGRGGRLDLPFLAGASLREPTGTSFANRFFKRQPDPRLGLTRRELFAPR